MGRNSSREEPNLSRSVLSMVRSSLAARKCPEALPGPHHGQGQTLGQAIEVSWPPVATISPW